MAHEIAYIDHSMRACLSNDSGKPPVPFDGPGEAQTWPTWSPNGRYVFYSAFTSGHNGHGRIEGYLHDCSTGETELLRANPPGSDGIGRRTPHYALWSPNSRMLALVARSKANQLTARLYHVDDDRTPATILQGSPIFLAWSRDSRRLLLHAGARHYLVDLEGEPVSQRMPGESRLYLTPSWSPRSDELAMLHEGEDLRSSLLIVDAAKQSATELAAFKGNSAFLWRPDGESIAAARDLQGDSRFYQSVWQISRDGDQRRIIDDLTLAFFWSPDGRQIAYLTTSEGAEGSVRWGLVDAESGQKRYLSDFLPTEEQLNIFLYFDQYAQSHNPWSPDGQSLLYSGALGYVRGRESLPQELDSAIIVEDTASGETREVARGILGAWSPRG